MNRIPLNPKTINRLLVRSTNWIGDAVMTTPAVRAIRRNFPNARITILAKPWVAPVFEYSPHVDDIFIYDVKCRHKGTRGKLRLARDLGKHRFDAAVLLQNAIEAALLAFFAKIPVRLGFDTDARRLLLTHPVRCGREIKTVHQTRYYLEILRGAGLGAGDTRLELHPGKENRIRARKIIEDLNVPPTDTLVGINPGATYGTAKRWFPERFAELSRKLIADRGAWIAVFGGPGEQELGREIMTMIGDRCVNCCGKTTLGEAIALIERCNLFVTNDSGLMHVAAALNVPQVAIFGSTDHTTTSPASPTSRIVRFPVDCAPCLKTDCPTDHRCMEGITVDRVFDAVDRISEKYA